MRILVLSDLHLELSATFTVPEGLEYDVVILAGDITTPGRKGVHWAARESTFGGRPVLYVAGNHEFYRAAPVGVERQEMRRAAEGTQVHVLDRTTVVIDGVRFVGCTLWTDFRIPVITDGVPGTDVARAISAASRGLNDFLGAIEIKDVDPRSHVDGRLRVRRRTWTPQDSLAAHWIDRDWLQRELDKPHDGPTVVVTHHAPSRLAVEPKYAGEWLTGCFVSDLEPEFFAAADVWVYGHTHSPLDVQIEGCRLLSNPRGYRLQNGAFENAAFRPLVVTV